MSSSPKQLSSTTTISNPNGATSPQPKTTPSPTTLSSTSPSSLASLLAESYHELESLRRELSTVRKRAEKAERLSLSLQALYTSENSSNADATSTSQTQTSPFPESATRILMDFEDRAVRAEIARDEAEARKRVLMDTWSQLDSYLIAVSDAAADARAGYGRIISESGGQLVLAQIPILPGSSPIPCTNPSSTGRHHRVSGRTPIVPSMTLPTNPYPYSHQQPNQNQNQQVVVTGTRRPRTPSMDGYQQPPSKRSRAEDRDRSGYVGESLHSAPFSHQQPYQGEYHNQDPYTPQHTYPPPPPPPHLQHATHQGHLAPPSSHFPQPQARMILPPQQNHHHSHSRSSRHRHASRSPHPNVNPNTHSRSRSSSSSASLSVDEMLLQATTGPRDENCVGVGAALPPPPGGAIVNGASPLEYVPVSRQRSSRRGDRDRRNESMSVHSPENMYSQSTSHHGMEGHVSYHDHNAPVPGASYRRIGGGEANGSGGETREFQTHIFAPPVTGAPTKKSKFSGQESPIPPPNPAHPGAPFPSVNDQGQRICRQCGVAGRLKEGKCVEKWGPGPMGPGTVCDRCRKKMKRVERRGTMDVASSTSVPLLQHPPPRQPHSQAINRTDTLPAHQSPYGPTSTHVYSTSSSHQPQASPPKSMRIPATPSPAPLAVSSLKDDDISIPTSEIGRGSEAAAAIRSHRSSPRNGNGSGHLGASKSGNKVGKVNFSAGAADSVGNGNGGGGGGATRASKRSLLGATGTGTGKAGASRSPLRDEEADADADADAELEAEVEIENELEGAAGVARKRTGGGVRKEVEVDGEAEADLLDAVDAAAEANSVVGEDD